MSLFLSTRDMADILGGLTNHVELVTRQTPESFEQTARRYIQNPENTL